jgi:glycine/D-amino acid oxidase-like deaminating enzyme
MSSSSIVSFPAAAARRPPLRCCYGKSTSRYGEGSTEIVEPEARDRLIPQKSRALALWLAALWPAARTDVEFRWSGTFDTTSDGLPLIGPAPGAKGVYAVYGYGGNGITFSFLAARLIGDLIAGKTSPLLGDFAIDRDGGKTG